MSDYSLLYFDFAINYIKLVNFSTIRLLLPSVKCLLNTVYFIIFRYTSLHNHILESSYHNFRMCKILL